MAKKHKEEHKEERIASSSAVEVSEVHNSLTLKVTWIAILALLFYVMVYGKVKGAEGEGEENAQEEVSAPDFDINNWFDGYYQDKTESFLKNDSRIGKDLLPLKNQLDYKAFHKISLAAYSVGKDDYFFCVDAIETWSGQKRISDSAIKSLLDKTKVIHDTLRQKGIDVVMVYIPTKEYFMPEVMAPAKYLKYPKRANDYERFIAGSKARGLSYVDMYSYFNSIRDKAPYPLYTQHGTHTSYYGECLMADTVIKYLEHLKGIEIPHIVWQDVPLSEEPKFRDGDAIGKSKLVEVGAELKPLAYPKITYSGSPNAQPIKVLGIGDSYYRAFAYLGVNEVAFGGSQFWYYNNTVVPENGTEAWELDLKAQIESHKAIIIMYCSNTLSIFSNGFVDDAYQLYTNPTAYYARLQKEKPIKAAKKKIHQDPEWMEEAQKLSVKSGISLDSAINLMAYREIKGL